jgi:hypothetical protein
LRDFSPLGLQGAGDKAGAFETWKKAIAMDSDDACVNNGMGRR